MQASLKKRERKSVACHITKEGLKHSAQELVDMLNEGRFTPSPTRHISIKDPGSGKIRDIYVPKFWPDQCVHWLLMLQISQDIMRDTYAYSCGSIPGRGVEYAIRNVKRWLDTDPQYCTWCLQMDISKFYQNIDHDALKAKFRRKYKDQRLLNLIDAIIDGHHQGVPIGFFTSQWFANFYLNDFDHFVKQILKAPHYVRFADDILILSPNKKRLIEIRDHIKEYLAPLGLTIKDGQIPGKACTQIFKPRDVNIHYLGHKIKGFRVSSTKYRYEWRITLDHKNATRIRKRAKRIGAKDHMSAYDASVVISDYGRVRFGSNWRFEKEHLRPYVDFDEAREIQSRHSKAEHKRKQQIDKRGDINARTGDAGTTKDTSGNIRNECANTTTQGSIA